MTNGDSQIMVFLKKQKNGSLLIDEVTEIPLETQAKILRVLIPSKNFEELMDRKKLM